MPKLIMTHAGKRIELLMGKAALPEKLVEALNSSQQQSSGYVEKIAIHQPIGGHRVVIAVSESGCDYADQQDASHCDRVIGMTTNAAAQNDICVIAGSGEDITYSSWSWQVNEPVFVGSNGLLTQTPPSTGFHQQFAVALTATTLYIDIHPAILLED